MKVPFEAGVADGFTVVEATGGGRGRVLDRRLTIRVGVRALHPPGILRDWEAFEKKDVPA